MSKGNFTASQKGNRKLEYKGFLYNKSITISKGIQQGNIKWRCERADLKCNVTIISNEDGVITREPTRDHCHPRDQQRFTRLDLKRKILENSIEHLGEAPVKILNEVITPEAVLNLPSELNLKQSIRYQRRQLRPKESQEAANLEITGPWASTLDNSKFYFGMETVEDDCAHIFTTENNLKYLSVLNTESFQIYLTNVLINIFLIIMIYYNT